MKRNNGTRLAVLGALYFAQGLPFGVQAHALPVYLREAGVSLKGIALLGLLAVPWMLKPLWAPLVDRWGSRRFGRRRSWIVPMQALLAIGAAAAAFTDPVAHLEVLLVLVLAMNAFAATQDIAVDGLAVDVVTGAGAGAGAATVRGARPALGWANSAQVVGYKLGMLTGGGLLVWLTARIHWRGAFLGMSALMLAVMVVTLLMREPDEGEGEARERVRFGELGRALLASVKVPGGLVVLGMVATYKLGESMADAMFKPFLVDHGFSAAQIGLWSGTWGMGASLLGSLAGGLLATRLPIVGALAITGALRAIPLAAEWWLTLGQPEAVQVVGITLAEHFFGGALTTAMFAFMMARVDPRIGATHFTALAALEVLGKAPAGIASGWIAERWGYPPVYAAAVAISAAWLLFFPLLRRVRSH